MFIFFQLPIFHCSHQNRVIPVFPVFGILSDRKVFIEDEIAIPFEGAGDVVLMEIINAITCLCTFCWKVFDDWKINLNLNCVLSF